MLRKIKLPLVALVGMRLELSSIYILQLISQHLIKACFILSL